jgi:tetratricopeptide (TPR) repeat protein
MHGLPRLANWYLSRALAIVDRVDHPLARPFIYLQMGVHKLCRGELEAAHELLFKARQGADSVGDLILWSDATVVSCEVACEMGDYEWVLATSEWMITVGRESAMKPAVRWGLLERGKALRRVGRLTEARPVLEEALELATGSQDIISAHAAAGELALLLMDAGEEGRADQVLEELEAFGRARKIRMFPICWSHLASSELRLRQLQRNPGDRASRRNAGRACKASERWAHRYRIALPGALRLQARLAWLTGRKRKAEVLWQRAITVAQEMGARHELVLAQREMNTYVASSASARELAYAGSKPTRRRFRS